MLVGVLMMLKNLRHRWCDWSLKYRKTTVSSMIFSKVDIDSTYIFNVMCKLGSMILSLFPVRTSRCLGAAARSEGTCATQKFGARASTRWCPTFKDP